MEICKRKYLSIDDDYKLSALQKWEKYKIFPIKLLLHCLLIVGSTYLVIVHNQVHGVTHRSIGQDFGRVFFPDDYAQYNGDAADNPQNRYFFFTLDDFNNSITLMMNRYWSLPYLSLAPTDIAIPNNPDYNTMDPNILPYPTVIHNYFNTDPTILKDTHQHPPLNIYTENIPMMNSSVIYPLTSMNNRTDLKNFITSLVTLVYDFRFRIYDPLPDTSPINPRACYEWQALFTYDFHTRHHFEVTWQYNALRRCPNDSTVNGWVASISVIVIILCIIHESLTVLAVYRWLRLFAKALMIQNGWLQDGVLRIPLPWETSGKQYTGNSNNNNDDDTTTEYTEFIDNNNNTNNAPNVSSSSSTNFKPVIRLKKLKVKYVLRLIRPWILTTSIGMWLVMIHAGILINSNFDVTSGRGQEVILGFGCASLWLSVMRYLDISPRFYSTVLTLRASLPKIGRFLIGAVPIFIGFGIFAIVVFGNHAVRYASPSIAYLSLFAFVNGDALREAYQHTEGRSAPPSSVLARAVLHADISNDQLNDYWWSNISRGGWAYGFSFFTIVGDLHLVLITLTFMYVVINCCVALVEEAFFDTRSADGELQLQLLKEEEAELRRRICFIAGESNEDSN